MDVPVLFGLTGPDGDAVYVRSDAIVACLVGVRATAGGAPLTILETTAGPVIVAESLDVLVRMLRATGLGIVAQRTSEPVGVTP